MDPLEAVNARVRGLGKQRRHQLLRNAVSAACLPPPLAAAVLLKILPLLLVTKVRL